ncbi:uncharacterized protein LOC132196404 [Neocloeon triangulifer]|uniref:uncharacterized protein LOC132196404 n=1 Tax=Neocloeon triangulifer TaxID=2078957 RepID=UPI00286F6670|nr:uncharacterized protein LOC132196404 [Neocloeon triangulifer]
MPGKPEEKAEKQAETPEKEPEQPNGEVNGDQDQEQVRELTQTDRLNRRLLSSLLERMNSNDDLMQRFSSTNNNQPQSPDQSADDFAT